MFTRSGFWTTIIIMCAPFVAGTAYLAATGETLQAFLLAIPVGGAIVLAAVGVRNFFLPEQHPGA